MAIKLGLDGKLYRNTGTYASPAWDLVGNVRDLTLGMEKATADVTTRSNNGWRAEIGTLKTATVEFEMVYDSADADVTAFRDAFLNNTSVEVAVADGVIATTGTQYFRSTMDVRQFGRNENLEEAMIIPVTMGPTYATNPPAWVTVS